MVIIKIYTKKTTSQTSPAGIGNSDESCNSDIQKNSNTYNLILEGAFLLRVFSDS